MNVRFFEEEGGSLLFTVDLGVYSLIALEKTVHRFTDRCFVHLQRNGECIEVRMTPKAATPNIDLPGEFCNDLLDQTLREKVAAETENERGLLLAHALSRTSLVANSAPSN